MSSQYFDADHRFKCTECDREFATGAGRDKVSFILSVRRLGTDPVYQHYDAAHQVITPCPECDWDFDTWMMMNNVHSQLLNGSPTDSCLAL